MEVNFLVLAGLVGVLLLDTSKSWDFAILSIVVHECAHLYTMGFLGFGAKKIKLGIFDIDILDDGRERRSFKDDILILLSGPAANFFLSGVFFGVYFGFGLEWCKDLAVTSAVLGVFNLLPIDSLDGGQVLFGILSLRFSERKSNMIVEICSFFCLLPLAVLGFWVLIRSKYNFTLLFLSCYLLIVLLIKKKS